MNKDLRDFMQVLDVHGQLRRITQPVDARYVSALIARTQNDTAVLVENPSGYDIRVAGGLLATRERVALALGCDYSQASEKMWSAMQKGIPPVVVRSSPVKEVIQTGDGVDLSSLPAPVLARADGGPFISAGICIAHDPELGYNAGIYRIQIRTRNRANISMGGLTDGWQFYKRAQERGEPFQVTINIGTHPFDFMSAALRTIPGKSELDLDGGLRGEPLELVPSETIGVEGLAGAEIILECEVLPGGRSYEEGKFGEFHGLMGGKGLAQMMVVKAVTRRRDAIYYALQMPGENNTCSIPMLEGSARRALLQAGIQVHDVHATLGGCAHWHLIASIKKRSPGHGKNALMALLNVGNIKHAIVTDDDIDVHDLQQVEWAIATRVQPERDVMIIKYAAAKPLDPSLALTRGTSNITTAKMGIDATRPENVPVERYDRIEYPYLESVAQRGLEVALARQEPTRFAQRADAEILGLLGDRYLYYQEIMESLPAREYREVVEAMADLAAAGLLERDHLGRYRAARGNGGGQ